MIHCDYVDLYMHIRIRQPHLIPNSQFGERMCSANKLTNKQTSLNYQVHGVLKWTKDMNPLVYIYIYIYINMRIYREREKEIERERSTIIYPIFKYTHKGFIQPRPTPCRGRHRRGRGRAMVCLGWDESLMVISPFWI